VRSGPRCAPTRGGRHRVTWRKRHVAVLPHPDGARLENLCSPTHPPRECTAATSLSSRAKGAWSHVARGSAVPGLASATVVIPTQMLSAAEISPPLGAARPLRPAPPGHPIAAGMPASRSTDDTEQAVWLARLLVNGPRSRIDPLTNLGRALTGGSAPCCRDASRSPCSGPLHKRAVAAILAGLTPERVRAPPSKPTNCLPLCASAPLFMSTPGVNLSTLVRRLTRDWRAMSRTTTASRLPWPLPCAAVSVMRPPRHGRAGHRAGHPVAERLSSCPSASLPLVVLLCDVRGFPQLFVSPPFLFPFSLRLLEPKPPVSSNTPGRPNLSFPPQGLCPGRRVSLCGAPWPPTRAVLPASAPSLGGDCDTIAADRRSAGPACTAPFPFRPRPSRASRLPRPRPGGALPVRNCSPCAGRPGP